MSDWLEELKRKAAANSSATDAFRSSMTSAASAQNPYSAGFRQWDSSYSSPSGQQQEQPQAPKQPTNLIQGASNAYSIYDSLFGSSGAAPGTQQVGTLANGQPMMNDMAIPGQPGAFSLSNIGSAGNAILPAAGAYGAFDLMRRQSKGSSDNAKGYLRGGAQGAASGAAIGSYFGPMGAAIGGTVGGVAGLAGAAFGSNKGKDQVARDGLRKPLKDAGILDDKWNLTFSDGGSWNMGADGNAKYIGADGKEHYYYQIDDSNPLNGVAVAYADPLADILGGTRNNMIEWYSNALMSGAKDQSTVMARAKELYGKLGITKEAALEQIQRLQSEGKLAEDRANAYRNTINSLGLTSNSSGTGGGGFGFDSRALAAEQKAARQQAVASQIMNFASQNNQNAMSMIGNKPSAAQALSQTSSPTQNPGAGFASFESSLSNILL